MTRWLALPIILSSALAQAATFPADADYRAFRCGASVMTDAQNDDSLALDDADLVGNTAAPAGLRASDADFLYLRIRVNRDPVSGAALAPHGWGMEFDLDGDLATYELLVMVDGITTPDGTVSIYTHHVTGTRDDPSDPADLPAVASFQFNGAAQIASAGSSIDGDADFFVDVAVPWSVLTTYGLGRNTLTHAWAGSTSVTNALDGDMACHDASGGGAPQLQVIVSTEIHADPMLDPPDGGGSGGSGGGGSGGGSGSDGDLRLEGGSGCQTGGSLGLGMALAFVAPLVLIGRRRRR